MTLQLIIDSDSFESDLVFSIQMRSHSTTSIGRRYELYIGLKIDRGPHRQHVNVFRHISNQTYVRLTKKGLIRPVNAVLI